MTTATLTPPHIRKHGLTAEWRALRAVVQREWTIFRRYPSWIIALFIWPIIFPMAYILSSQALAGPNGGGLLIFQRNTGTTDVVGYIAIGTIIWMWQNVVLWNVGFALREEQLRGTLESNWLSPSWRFSLLLGNSAVQMVTMLIFIGVSLLEFSLFFGVRFNGDPLVVATDVPGVDSVDLRVRLCICQHRDYGPRSQRLRLSSARSGDDLLRHHLSDRSAASMDAKRGDAAAANLHHLWFP